MTRCTILCPCCVWEAAAPGSCSDLAWRQPCAPAISAGAGADALAGEAAARALELRGLAERGARARKKKALTDFLRALEAAGASRRRSAVPAAERSVQAWFEQARAAPGPPRLSWHRAWRLLRKHSGLCRVLHAQQSVHASVGPPWHRDSPRSAPLQHCGARAVCTPGLLTCQGAFEALLVVLSALTTEGARATVVPDNCR